MLQKGSVAISTLAFLPHILKFLPILLEYGLKAPSFS